MVKSLQKTYPLITDQYAKILRKICEPVKKVSPKIISFWETLLQLMREYEGVWLAAPQIWKDLRMAAVTQRDTSWKDHMWRTDRKLTHEFIIINPIILSQSENMKIDAEACLSLPGMKWDVKRPSKITIQYTGLDGKKHIHKATGFNARVILHEMDHLDWILFIDKLV